MNVNFETKRLAQEKSQTEAWDRESGCIYGFNLCDLVR